MQLKIAQAEEKDIQSILEILNHEILNSTVVYYYKERTYQEQLYWFQKKQKDNMPVLVAKIEDKVVGYGSFGIFRPWDAYKFSVEHSIYVSKDFRNKGIGKQLLIKLIQLAKESGFHTMIAGVDATNSISYQLHKQFGFEEVGTFKQIGYKFDKWLDLKFLQLFLNQ